MKLVLVCNACGRTSEPAGPPDHEDDCVGITSYDDTGGIGANVSYDVLTAQLPDGTLL